MNQCEKCEGYGVIEGKYCDCSIGEMALRDALNRGDHVAVAFNHETGKKDVFVDHKHAEVAPSRSAAPAKCPRCDANGINEAADKCIPIEGECPIVEAGFWRLHQWPTEQEFKAKVADMRGTK